jgi:type IV fimbrial biogenesis protein FimT
MVTVVIAGILASMAVPSFTQAINNNRMSTQINELLATLNYARSEAIKRSNDISVCNSSDGTSCSGSWKDGWIVFVDTNKNGAVDGEDVLRVHMELSGGNIMTFTGSLDSFISYESNGLVNNRTDGSVANSSGIYTLCDSRGDTDKKGIDISTVGRGSVVVPGDLKHSNLASC